MRISEFVNRIAQECAWEAVNAGYMAGQRCVWLFTGTYWRLRQSRKPENFDKSAQVLNIVGRFKFDEYLTPGKTSDFILTHDSFDSPERVLKDNASLYQVTENEAIFVEAPTGHDLWRARYSPFVCYAQFKYAVRVIRMPITSFHRLADTIGDPKNVTFIVNTARCGSTLLTQMFEKTGKVVAISEPTALNVLTKRAEEHKGRDNKESLNKLIVSTVRMLCKPTNLGEVAYVIKMTGPTTPRLPDVVSLFPQANCLFMYRDGLKVAQSVYRLSESIYSIKTIYAVGKRSKWRMGLCLSSVGFPSEDYSMDLYHPLAFGTILWSVVTRYYLRFREAGMRIAAVRYEDIIADPEPNMRRVLSFCGLPEDWAAGCGKATEDDSQKGTPLSSEVLSRYATLEYSGEAQVEVDKILEMHGLPPYSRGSYIAPGTITTSPVANGKHKDDPAPPGLARDDSKFPF